MKKILIIITTCLAFSSNLFASGWNDYELDIGDGYKIFRMNSLDVNIGKSDGLIILDPRKFDGVGPVTAYQMLNLYILAKTKGRKDRNLFEGDTFQDVDYEKNYYFIIRKADDFIFGPFKQIQFQNKISELNIEYSNWIQPKNPNPHRSIIGSLLFLIMAIPILGIKYFYISIPILVFLIWRISQIIKHKRHRTNQSNGSVPPPNGVDPDR